MALLYGFVLIVIGLGNLTESGSSVPAPGASRQSGTQFGQARVVLHGDTPFTVAPGRRQLHELTSEVGVGDGLTVEVAALITPAPEYDRFVCVFLSELRRAAGCGASVSKTEIPASKQPRPALVFYGTDGSGKTKTVIPPCVVTHNGKQVVVITFSSTKKLSPGSLDALIKKFAIAD